MTDFTRGISDAVPVFSGSTSGGGAPLAFAGVEPPASSRFDDAFASIPSLASAYAGDTMAFKAPTAVYADGTAVWSRGFAGQRIQQQDGTQPRNTNAFYGGMMGADFAARPDLRYGIFLGGGQTRSRIDLNQVGSDSDLVFGGAYARYDIGQSFLHAAVQGGASHNSATTRTINNNLAAGGIETARAAFDGWYVSPEATFGHRLALGKLAGATYTLTPSVRVRYLYGAFDGYTETGTTAPLTVGTQTVNTLEERGELKMTRSISFTPQDQLSTSIYGGVLGTQRLGGATVNAALLGQAIPFATPGAVDVWGGFGGLGLEWRTRNVTLFSTAEYLALSDNSTVVSGRAGLRVGF
ncbi:autotransporter outer membrane beta-barrel domain-containing protein [Bradyrhizobium liaoningense]|uniref:autotransporter outer membrane beta-barrel domain-containing protein n=1 Tax=Bradyrhizobium liaoningense TaxID=43992 RepID=UPI001BAC3C49|nr:autotransporter outer membrane beta-barrel domain-containing protein [Bradyrhizobium liaoningense]MBR0718686.1 autotransporter outer membrane beta-barrel domain-containing protein [Bradyrhizobium liaoningense]